MDAIKFGAEYRGFNNLVLQAGYSYNNNPISSRDVTLNILAPGVVKHHISGGLSYNVTPSSTIDLAAIVSLKNSVTGFETTPLGPNYARSISIYLSQFEVTAGWTHKFDAGAPPVVAAKF